MKMLLSALMIATLCAATIRSAAQSPVPFDIVEATVDDVQTALRSGQVTCRSLVEHGSHSLSVMSTCGWPQAGRAKNVDLIPSKGPRRLGPSLEVIFSLLSSSSKMCLERSKCPPKCDLSAMGRLKSLLRLVVRTQTWVRFGPLTT
jgi:hypothetical protein